MNPSPKHPSLYEINTRVLLNELGAGSTLSEIPAKFWKGLQAKGIDWVWLMGVWEIQEKTLDPELIPPDMMTEFRTLIPDLEDRDICGSPYAIHDYSIDPVIGDAGQLRKLRKKLHKLGMKLILDFVPNHFGAHSRWITERPEYFIEITEDIYRSDNGNRTYYQPFEGRPQYFAHGRDPYFDAWQDTVQVNYFNTAVHVWMTGILKEIAGMCDGVRCDMAMLPVQRVFQQTWGRFRPQNEQTGEFWPKAIREVKILYPDFLFLAECYWDMEAELMEMGFDYGYDKVFFDRMLDAETDRMRQHFHAEPWWLMRTARFLENHDEERVNATLALQKMCATAALVALGPGLRFWHMGQWEGRRKKVPVQIRRFPAEAACGCLIRNDQQDATCPCAAHVYARLMEISNREIFREGEWCVVHEPVRPGLILWEWQLEQEHVLVAVNYGDMAAPFSLSDILRVLRLADPVDVITGTNVAADGIQALAPWSVSIWKTTGE